MSKYVLTSIFLLIAALPFLPFLEQAEEGSLEVPPGAEVLLITSPHNREVKMEYSRAFTEWMKEKHGRNVGIRWLDVGGGTSKILKDLESRFKANQDAPGVDILFGGGVDPFIRSAKEGWLAPVEVSEDTLAAIPERCAGLPVYDTGRRWFGVALSGFGIIYNRTLVRRLNLPEPKGWGDLAKKAYFSWVGSGDPRSSGSVHMCYEIILQAYGFETGWAVITRFCANVRRFGEGGGTGPREVAAGDVVAGMVISQYAQRTIMSMDEAYEYIHGAKPRESALGFCLPEGTTVINPDAIAVLKGAPNPDLAAVFVRFTLSEEGQRILFQPSGVNGQLHGLHRMPVREALYKDPHAPEVNPYSFETGMRYSDSKGGRRWRILNDLIGKWCIDAHEDLAAAWSAIIKADAGDLAKKLCAAPLTEEELFVLAKEWKTARVRQRVLNEWATQARDRYRSLREEAERRLAAKGDR